MLSIPYKGHICQIYVWLLITVGILYSMHVIQSSRKLRQSPSVLSYNAQIIANTLGYDPRISLYSDIHTKIPAQQDKHITVYVHGWGDSQKSIPFFQRNTYFLPGHTIGFDFRDAHFGCNLPPYKYSNFCQAGDIASLLIILKTMDTDQVEAIHLFGHARGGGTIITMLARLTRYKKHRKFFKRLHISKPEAKRLLTKIKAGTVVLNHPFINPHSSLQEKLNWLHLGFLTPIIRYIVLPCITAYQPHRDSPLHAASIVQSLNIPMLVYMQKDSLIQGNSSDALFYQRLMGPHTYLVADPGGGHAHTSITLSSALQAFRKEYGGPYYAIPSLLNQGRKLLSQSPTSADHVEHYLQKKFSSRMPKQYPKHPKYTHLYAPVNTQKYLDYDACVTMHQADPATTGQSTTIYVHGYGENPQAVVPFYRLNSYILPGSTLSFSFSDITPGSFIPNLRKSNLGQKEDIKSLAYILKVIDERGLDTINLFGCSRGGATIINTLAHFLQYNRYESFFVSLTISAIQAKRILTKIKRGTIILNVPLVDTRSVARHWFGTWSTYVLSTIVPSICTHDPEQDQAIDAALIIKPLNFRILVHFEYKDKIVGNEKDAEFYKNIMGPHTYLILANEGGHMHTGNTLGAAIQAFNKKYGQSYFPIPELLAEGNSFLTTGQPTYDQVESFVRDTYAEYAKNIPT